MKVLHAINMIFPIAGIINQMRSEQLAADAAGLEWNSKIFTGFCNSEKLFEQWKGNTANRLGFKRDFYRWLASVHGNYDVILLRHTPYDPLEYLFIKNSIRPVFLVLHTLYVSELSARGGLKGKLQSMGERLIGPINFRTAFGLIAVTDEIGRHAKALIGSTKEALSYPNGIFWEQPITVIDSARILPAGKPEVVFIASNITPWHGTSKLIESIRKSDRSFVFHLVGNPNSEFKKLAQEESRVILHGYLDTKDLAKVTNGCTVGVSSLAISSLGMKEACPLKTREYLLHGLPVYGAHREPFPETFKFYRQGEAEIDSILNYAEEMRGVLRREIAESARPYIDKSLLLLKLESQIGSVLSRAGNL